MFQCLALAADYHVAKSGSDSNAGTSGAPFLTINHAAQVAEPGDRVIVHAGEYRERVDPARGGTSDSVRITYMAAAGETVKVKGSEQVTGWKRDGSTNVYYATLDPQLFGAYNPFTIELTNLDKAQSATDPSTLRTLGEVYLNDSPLTETNDIQSVYSTSNSWKASKDGLTVFANFNGVDPNASPNIAEINAREQIFAPSTYGLGYITVDGFIFEHAANQYPYRFYKVQGNQQQGAVSTNGGHDWVIRNNKVKFAKSIGIQFGYGGQKTFEDAGYGQATNYNVYEQIGRIGYDLIQNNEVDDSGTDGIMGMWGPFTRIIGNVVQNTNRDHFVKGYEAAGIKTHFFFNGLIQDNLIRGNDEMGGIWLDNSSQNTRVTGNIFVNNTKAIYAEITQGVLIDNNVMINSPMIHSSAEGAIVAHNLFYSSSGGSNDLVSYQDSPTPRVTPTYLPGSATVSDGNKINAVAHNQYLNNIFIGKGLTIPTESATVYGNRSDDNVFYDQAGQGTAGYDTHSVVSTSATGFSYVSDNSGAGGTPKVTVAFNVDHSPFTIATSQIQAGFVGADPFTGWRIGTVDTDVYGNAMSDYGPVPGPFADLSKGGNSYTLWPKPARAELAPPVPAEPATNDNDSAIDYEGTWIYSSDTYYTSTWDYGDVGGDVHYTLTNGDYAQYTFTGSSIDYVTERSPDQGSVDVYIDGVLDRTLDLYSRDRLAQQTVYSKTFPSSGPHTIKIVKTSGKWAILDAFQVHASAEPLSMSAAAWPTVNIGQQYRYQVQVSGGTAPYTFALAAGSSLPAGLSLDADTGVIEGVATAPGSEAITVTVTDSASTPGTASATFHPLLRETIAVTNPDLEGGVTTGWTAKGTAVLSVSGTTVHSGVYSLQTTRTQIFDRPAQNVTMVPGITYDFSLWIKSSSGSYTGQMVLDFGTGTHQGEPNQYAVLDGRTVGTGWVQLRGSYRLSGNQATASPSFYPQLTGGTTAFYIDDVNEPRSTLTLSAATLPDASYGAAYSHTFAAAGGTAPYRYEITSGSLPPGLTLNAANGTVTGVPEAVGSGAFDVTVTDSQGYTAVQSYALATANASNLLTNGDLEGGTAAGWTANDSATLTADAAGAHAGSYGMRIDRLAGHTGGRPSQVVALNKGITYQFSSWLKLASGSQTAQLVLDFGSGAHQGEPNRYAVLATASAGTGWVQLSGTYRISGSAATASPSFYVQLTSGSGDTYYVDDFTMREQSTELQLGAFVLPDGKTGESYPSQTFTAAGGFAPYTYTISGGTLPSGLKLAAATGVLSGTPLQSGTFPLTVAVKDGAGVAAESSAVLTVQPLIANGDLETGTASGWTAANSAVVSAAAAAARSGAYGMHIDRSANPAGSPAQTITLQGGKTYDFSAWLRMESGTANAKLVLDFGPGAHQGQSGQYVYSSLASAGTDWTQLTASAVTIAGASSVTPSVYFVVDGTGNYDLDDVSTVKPLVLLPPAPADAVKGQTYPSFTFQADGLRSGNPYFTNDTAGNLTLPPGLRLRTGAGSDTPGGQIVGKPIRTGTHVYAVTVLDGAPANGTSPTRDSQNPNGRSSMQWFAMTTGPMANQAANGDFESGATTGWSARNGATLSANNTVQHGGSYSLKVSRTAVNSSAQQTLNLTAGIYYDFSVWVKLDSGAADAKLLLDVGTTTVTTKTLDLKSVGSSDWVELSGTYKPVSGATTAKLYVEFAGSSTVPYYMDDAAVD